MQDSTITLQEALQRMRELSNLNIPFSIGFYSYNSTNHTSNGYKTVDKAILRKGLRADVSDKSDVLIAYTDFANEKPRQFYLPLLMVFNNHHIKVK